MRYQSESFFKSTSGRRGSGDAHGDADQLRAGAEFRRMAFVVVFGQEAWFGDEREG